MKCYKHRLIVLSLIIFWIVPLEGQYNCSDTDNWRNSFSYSCFDYQVNRSNDWWCPNGTYTWNTLWTDGNTYYYPEFNCCGYGYLSPLQFTSTSTINNSTNSSEIGIMHLQDCKTLPDKNQTRDFKCLGPLNFTTTNITMNETLYNCPLDCSFDWNTTKINTKQSVNMSRRSIGSSILYYLSSQLFSNLKIICGSITDEDYVSGPPLITSEGITYSMNSSRLPIIPQSTMSSNTLKTSTNLPITTQQSGAWQPPTCSNGKIGLDCNTSIDHCLMIQPCRNNGTCIPTNSSYICLCPPSKFSGKHCEIDIRPCKSYTCLSHGICIERSPISFVCQCEEGYEGIHCESLINYCKAIKCQNNGQCRPTLLNFTCECPTKDYSGRYCEITSASLTTKQTINRSFAYIAISVMILTIGSIVFMDVLKYGFKIEPIKEQRQRLVQEKRKRPKVIRFVCIHVPKLETISEECDV